MQWKGAYETIGILEWHNVIEYCSSWKLRASSPLAGGVFGLMDLKALSASILLALRGVPGQPCTVDLADEKYTCERRFFLQRGRQLGGDLREQTPMVVGFPSTNVQLCVGATFGRLLEAGSCIGNWMGMCGAFWAKKWKVIWCIEGFWLRVVHGRWMWDSFQISL